MLDFDKLLAEASLPQETVPICLDGNLVRRYEDMKQRIDDRAAQAEPLPGDDRLNPPKPVPDPEQADLDALIERINATTVPFIVGAMPRDKFVEFAAEARFQARKDPKGDVDPRDRQINMNTSTFVPALVRASIVDPDVTDDTRWEKLAGVLSFPQMRALFTAAWTVNQEDREVPFWPGGSPSLPGSAPA